MILRHITHILHQINKTHTLTIINSLKQETILCLIIANSNSFKTVRITLDHNLTTYKTINLGNLHKSWKKTIPTWFKSTWRTQHW